MRKGGPAAAAAADPGAPDRGGRILQAARRLGPVRGGRRGHRRRPGGGQPADHRRGRRRDGRRRDQRGPGGHRPAQRTRAPAAGPSPASDVVGASDLLVKLAKCCTPVPGDPIIGFVTKGSGVSVHRTDCVNAASLRTEPERLIPVEWAPTAKSSFLVAIQVEALDRNRLLSDITRALSDQHVNILSAAPEHQQGPDLPGQVHLRDRRPDAPRPRAPGHPQRARRLRRLPHQPVADCDAPRRGRCDCRERPVVRSRTRERSVLARCRRPDGTSPRSPRRQAKRQAGGFPWRAGLLGRVWTRGRVAASSRRGARPGCRAPGPAAG